MVIREIMQTLSGVYEITTVSGSAFFLRTHYLNIVDECSIFAGAEFSGESESDILNAALAYSAEFSAMSYLSRAEHCRFQLEQKLIKKNHDKNSIAVALDYLEGIGMLNDVRFAGAWLRTRSIDHFEGKIRLSAELVARGVKKDACRKAIEEFFEENDEEEICRRAYLKIRKFRGTDEKIRSSLMQKGFSLKMVNEVIKTEGKN